MPDKTTPTAQSDWLLETRPGSADFLTGSLQTWSDNFTPSSPPSLADEVAFISGVYPDGTLPLYAYAAWNRDIPATYDGGFTTSSKWGSNQALTTGGTVNYYFDPASSWSGAEQTALAGGLALWSAVANISFVQTGNAGQAQIKFVRATDGGAVTGSTYSWPSGAGETGGHTLLTRLTATISIDTSVAGFGPIDGNFRSGTGNPTTTYLHEEGHALGLGHSGPYNNSAIPSQKFGPYDTRLWSIMSYFDAPNSFAFPGGSTSTVNWQGQDPTGLMPLDILAVQALYGTPTSTPLSGGQVFGFNSNISGALGAFFDFNQNSKPILALWDAGGNNTLDLSGFSSASTVNLNPGSFSSVAGMQNNLAIALNTSITSFIGGSGDDSVTGTAGADTLYGGLGTDTLYGGDGNDLLDGGGGGPDTIIGGNGNDMIIVTPAGGVTRTIDGGAGSDSISFATAASTVQINLNSGAVQVTPSGSLTISNIENLVGSPFNDFFIGNAADNSFDGGGGASDVVSYGAATSGVTVSLAITTAQNTGGAGIDTLINIENLYGSPFDDVLAGNGVSSQIIGGAGIDTLSLAGATGGVTLSLSVGTSQLTGGGGTMLVGMMENITGSAFADTLTGSAVANTLSGGAGADVLYGVAGDDILRDGGETSNRDFLYGGSGNDTYYVTSAYTAAAEDLVYEGGTNPDLMAGVGDVDIIHSGDDFFWDFYSVGEVLYNDAATGSPLLVAGKDVLNKTIYGGAGNDRVVTYGHNSVVDLGAGTDAVDFGSYGLDSSYNGQNSLIMRPGTGTDYIYNFHSGVDKVDLTAFHFGITGAQVLAQAVNVDNAGTANDYSYFYLTNAGGVNNFVVFIGLLGSQLQAGDFLT